MTARTLRAISPKRFNFPEADHIHVLGTPIIGAGTWIGIWSLLDASGGLIIGKGCTISAGVHIYTHISGPGCGAEVERKPVYIEDNVYIGPKSIITMGVRIGKGAIIGAMSLVNRNVGRGEFVCGIPAVKKERRR